MAHRSRRATAGEGRQNCQLPFTFEQRRGSERHGGAQGNQAGQSGYGYGRTDFKVDKPRHGGFDVVAHLRLAGAGLVLIGRREGEKGRLDAEGIGSFRQRKKNGAHRIG